MLDVLLAYEMIADSPEEAGSYGEMIVNSVAQLKKYRDQEHYLFKDVYIENSNGVVQQIDHIFIFKTGIFVVETKMFSDKRVVADNENTWYATDGSHKLEFYNPIKQNESHARAVKELLGNLYDVAPLVVFAWNNKPKINNPCVLNFSEFKDYPLNHKPERELNSDDMKYICDVLIENDKHKSELKKKHQDQLNRLKKT